MGFVSWGEWPMCSGLESPHGVRYPSTEPMSQKTWKDHLLSSGLPLEQSVIGVLQTLGVNRPREYRYERLNEQGILTEFSIDVFASRMYEHALVLELLIECKYRHD